MTDQEIVQSLHVCGEDRPCGERQVHKKEKTCIAELCKYAIALIERLTAENAALREMQWRKIASDGTPQEKGYYIAFVERAIGEKPTVRQAYCKYVGKEYEIWTG